MNNEEWISDTGASSHMISQEDSLHNLHPYNGLDHVMLGNGDFLNITHVSNATISSSPSKIILPDVLLVPKLGRSLFSIG